MAPHHHVRGERRIARRQGKKKAYDRILIVCEGEKTEVNYFEAIRKEKRLPSADIQVMPGDGTQPIQVVDFALAKFNETKDFEKVYAVFDRDDHPTYRGALDRAAALEGKLKKNGGGKVTFAAIPSVPSFELWFLLHFKDVLAPMHRDDVYRQLKDADRYPTYEKNSITVYDDLKGSIPDATQRAEHLRDIHDKFGGVDPYTDADLLTGVLTKMER